MYIYQIFNVLHNINWKIVQNFTMANTKLNVESTQKISFTCKL